MTIGAQFMCQDFEECIASVQEGRGSRATATPGSSTRRSSGRTVYVYMTYALDRTEQIVVGTAVTNPCTRAT